MSRLMFRFFGAAIAFLAASEIGLASSAEIADPANIGKLLETVPFLDASMPYQNLAERLPKLGIKVEMITYGPVSVEEVKSSASLYKRGDVLYFFATTSPNDAVVRICPIWNSFALIRRNSRWLPDDRTANFLINNKCAAP